ncbi:glycosyltransferase family 39 protein [Lapillicoccus sp.]|uniref:ArnT family glycosyltransferase n=1 Tax=Lapillicoccus sp. TaxID=1909287 RepID=UPI003262DBBB
MLAALGAIVVSSGYVGLAAWHGALGAARNDDWVYYRLAFNFATTGRLSFDPYTSTMLVGQVAMASPVVAVFGQQIAPLQIAVAALSALTLWMIYRVLRDLLEPFWALFCVACLAAGPIWGNVSVTFMSDVPAMALMVLALLVAVRAFRGPAIRWGWLIGSLALCLAAFTVREYSAAAAGAILLTLLIRGRRSVRIVLVAFGAGALWMAVAVALFLWRATLVTGDRALAAGPSTDKRMADVIVGFVTTLGFLLFPVVVAVIGRGLVRTLLRWAPLLVVLVAGFTWAALKNVPLLTGNYIRLGGSYSGTLTGSPPRVFSKEVWWVLVAMANVSTAVLLTLLVAHVVSSLRRRATPSITSAADGDEAAPADTPASLTLFFCFGLVTVLLAIGVCLFTGGRPLDRYVLPAVPFLAAVAAYTARRFLRFSARPVLAVVAVLAMGGVGLAQVDASATFDGAKWRLGQQVTKLGYEPATIDAGYEWFGFHQPGRVVYHPVRSTYPFWVTDLFRDAQLCASGRFAPRPVRATPYAGEISRVTQRSLLGVRYTLYARTADRGCRR